MTLKVIPEKCAGCHICELVCSLYHFKVNNPKKSRIRVQTLFPEPGINKPVVCRQCKKPACMEACPEGAITIEQGTVKLNPQKCTGCKKCLEACPFGALFTHPDIPYPLKCDLCNGDPQCLICPKGAIVFVSREEDRSGSHRNQSKD
jgi:Fe-S-cluster-containing hydrogenase component 2